LDAVALGLPGEPQLPRRSHVAQKCRGSDHGGAREIALAAHAHAVGPVAIERGDGALAAGQGVGALAETGAAPRVPDLAPGLAEDLGDGLALEPGVRTLDLA